MSLDTHPTMSSKTHNISIHHTNIYNPKPLGITCIAHNINLGLIAITREYFHRDVKTEEFDVPKPSTSPINLIEIYNIEQHYPGYLIETIIEYENITGITWLDRHHLLTVSEQQTISVYDTRSGSKIYTTLTDYGPILSIKYLSELSLLLTGTKFGYVVAYDVQVLNKVVQPIGKLVKINESIEALECTCNLQTIQEKTNVSSNKKSSMAPGKRKRATDTDGEDESSDEEEDTDGKTLLDRYEIVVFGASRYDVTVWDFHKRTIIDTINVCDRYHSIGSLLALKNGDLLVGDSKGTILLFDHNTFTCRQTIQVLDQGILCLAKNAKEKSIIASGVDSAIAILKKNKSETDELIFKEKIELHTHDVSVMIFINKKEFFSGGRDGYLSRVICNSKRNERKTLHKSISIPDYGRYVKFYDEEMLIQYEKSIAIWKLPKASDNNLVDPQQVPDKILLLKTKRFIQESAFNKDWIIYSTKQDLNIFMRCGRELRNIKLDKNLVNCNLLELCSNINLLIAVSQNRLHLIKMIKPNDSLSSSDAKCKVITEEKFVASITNLKYISTTSQLLVSTCESKKTNLFKIDIDVSNPKHPKIVRSKFGHCFVAFFTQNLRGDTYAYTMKNQVIKMNTEKKLIQEDQFKKLDEKKPIEGLPTGVVMRGMLLLDDEYCILYTNDQMFKVDLDSNQVVNENSKYKYIIKMDNLLFNQAHKVALIGVAPGDYSNGLPLVKDKHRYTNFKLK